MKQVRLLVVLPALVLLVGCGGSHDPIAGGIDQGTAPAVQQQSDSHYGTGNRVLWGLWKISISADRQTVTVLPDRVGALHFNVVRLIEVAPCSDCLRIKNVKGTADGLSADVILIHPFPGLLQYTGFDVRGIFISGARYTFPASGRKIAWGDDVARMLNSDGYTHLFNPTNFPYTSPPILGYIPGHKAPGGDLSATLNPYVAYEQDKPRCVFMPGTVSTRTVFLYLPPGPLEFGYAVDASWFPAGVEVTDPVNDFPPEANAFEAYRISVEVGTEMEHGYGSAPIAVEVYDHQGLDTIESVMIEAPDLFSGEVELTYTQTTPEGGFVFEGAISNTLGGRGVYPLLVRVRDTVTDGNLGRVDAFQIESVLVKLGWARTWGGIACDRSQDVAVDSAGNVYVIGCFEDAVDFDPGPRVEEQSSNGLEDVFLSKFDSLGRLEWARVWGGPGYDSGTGVAVDGFGSVVVAGGYGGTADFDPGPGIDSHDSNGGGDIFASKFDPSGAFVWARTWGGASGESAKDIAVDSFGGICTTGIFFGTVDFDPGPGVVERTPQGPCDTFVCKLDASGDFEWVHNWGHGTIDCGYGVAVDASDDIYVVGQFNAGGDFDPGPGLDFHASPCLVSSFLCKYYPTGAYQWARTWGGPDPYTEVFAYAVAADSEGSIYVTGKFRHIADFDPSDDGVDSRDSGGDYDIYLSQFDSSGAYFWARTWAGAGDMFEDGKLTGVSVDGPGDVVVAGKFLGSVDFDPGPGTDYHESNGEFDVFLSKFDSTGSFRWARTWGGIYGAGYGEECHSVSCDSSGNICVSGSFTDRVDFDPGPGTCELASNGLTDLFLTKFPPDGYW